MTHPLRRRASLLALSVVPALLALATPAPADAGTGCPAARASVIRSAPGTGRTVALTFDDGPGPFTPAILRVLRRYDVRATFFDTGAHDARYPELTREIAAEGHLLGDHTWSHRYPTQVHGGWTRGYLDDQLTRTAAQQRTLGGRTVCFFRPPGGYLSSDVVGVAAAHGLSTVLWSVDTEDWKQPATTTGAATDRIVARAAAGLGQSHPVVLMHTAKASHEPESQVSSNRSNDVAALARVIRLYRSHGYRFVDLLGRSGLPAREWTALDVSTSLATVPAGSPATVLRGRLVGVEGPVARQPVRWLSRPHGDDRWVTGGTLTTDIHGRVRLVARPTAATDYMLAFAGTRHFAAAANPASSVVRTVTYPTTVTVTPSADSVEAGTPVTLSLRVTSDGTPRAHAAVTVTRTVGGETTTVATLTTDSQGRAAVEDVPAADASYRVEVAEALPFRAGHATTTVVVAAPPPTDPGTPTPPVGPTPTDPSPDPGTPAP